MGYPERPLYLAFEHPRMPATWMVVRHRQWLTCLVLSAVLLAAGCAGKPAPAKDLGAEIDRVAATLIEQPLLHSTSIGIVYRGKEYIRHRGDMQAGKRGTMSGDHTANAMEAAVDSLVEKVAARDREQ